ncbi:Uncharacterized protein FKW44_023746, partial [Caligus rogercresseyi]
LGQGIYSTLGPREGGQVCGQAPRKFSGSEKDNIYVNLEIFGDPVPKVEWYKGFKDLSMEGGRFKAWTDGPSNSAVLGVEHVKQEDEGAYKCIVSNEHGESEHEFNIYVT